MSDFKAKMHQIRFPVGLRLRPRWGIWLTRKFWCASLVVKGRLANPIISTSTARTITAER